MPTQTIVWTAVPAGIGPGRRPRLSVHIAPRLVPDTPAGVLSAFPDWLDWPATPVYGWIVRLGNGAEFGASLVSSPLPSSARWRDLFAPTTPVRGRAAVEDFTQRRIRSYPIASVLAHVRNLYTDVAVNAPDRFPARSRLAPYTGPLSEDRLFGALQRVEALNGPPNFAIGPRPPDPTFDFAQLRRFLTPGATRADSPADNPVVPRFDFHDMCALAQDHAHLLRLLGLVVDLELDTPVDFTLPVTTVRVLVAWEPALPDTVNVSPLTVCELSPLAFRALPSAASVEIADGYLRLEDPAVFGVSAVDQDGAALQAMHLARSLEMAAARPSSDTPDEFSLSALRAEGIAIYRRGRAAALRGNTFVRGLALDADLTTGAIPGDNVILYAEDLVQGARLDAQAGAGAPWLPLAARQGLFRFTASGAVEVVPYDEAPTNTAATTPHKGSDDLYLSEEIAAWSGWSLGAPRPMLAIDNDDELMVPSSRAHPNGLPLEISYRAAPGTLPRLRYGQAYRFRGRVADVAGNSLPVTDPSAAHATAPVFFGRFEPVASPTVLLRRPRGPGETSERVVLRSNYDVPPSETAERHLAAPKVSQLLCERHGLFDTGGSPSVVDPAAYGLIVAREARTFRDLPSARPDGDTEYYDVDGLAVPYLPDPLARGALLRGLGSGPVPDVTVPFDGTWPDSAAVRLRLRERMAGDPEFAFTPGLRRLDVFLPKAERRTVRLSCVPDPAILNLSGLWQWIVEAGGGSSALADTVRRGRHWMFTPYRVLELIHAVKQPLETPEFDGIVPVRQVGQHFATLSGVARFSRKSTARIDLEARWDEYLDDGPGTALPTRPDPANPGSWLDRPAREAVAVSVPVAEEQPPGLTGLIAPDVFSLDEAPLPGPRHHFGDTKRRDVAYRARAFSRFDDFFRATGTADFGVANPLVLDPAGVVAGSVRLSTTENTPQGPITTSYSEGVDFTVVDSTGEVTRLESSTMPARVDASWVPRPNDRQESKETPVTVPASARPEPPKLLYIVPTFAWEDRSGGDVLGRRRRPGGLRVYLERPWWTSGGGELLGVLLPGRPTGQTPLPDAEARVATQWAVDPAHAGAPTPDTPAPVHFPRAVASAAGLSGPDAPGVTVGVAGHAVGFDETRDLWYCDVEVDVGAAYMPFVRLALARWQPAAVAGEQLSSAVLADYVQLTPERAVTVTPIAVPGLRDQYRVQLTGPAYDLTATDPAGLVAQVTVQRKIPGVSGPLGWESVGRPRALSRKLLPGPTVLFEGLVRIAPRARAAGVRLLIEEFERLRADDRPGKRPRRYGLRPVFADVIEL